MRNSCSENIALMRLLKKFHNKYLSRNLIQIFSGKILFGNFNGWSRPPEESYLVLKFHRVLESLEGTFESFNVNSDKVLISIEDYKDQEMTAIRKTYKSNLNKDDNHFAKRPHIKPNLGCKKFNLSVIV